MNMIHPQDAAEEIGDGYRNSLQRLHAQSSTEADRGSAAREQARQLLNLGFSLVICYYPLYCRSTDGYIGEGFAVEAAFSTRDAAEAKLVLIYAGEPDENRYEVWPKLPTTPVVAEVSHDEVPF